MPSRGQGRLRVRCSVTELDIALATLREESRPEDAAAMEKGKKDHQVTVSSDVSRLNWMSESTGKQRNHLVNWLTMRPAAMLAQ